MVWDNNAKPPTMYDSVTNLSDETKTSCRNVVTDNIDDVQVRERVCSMLGV